jgi:hypothetical protein
LAKCGEKPLKNIARRYDHEYLNRGLLETPDSILSASLSYIILRSRQGTFLLFSIKKNIIELTNSNKFLSVMKRGQKRVIYMIALEIPK